MPLSGDGGTYEYLREHVNQGRVVALLGDRDVAKSGMSNEFFGHRASLPIGAALLAIDTGSPLFTCAPWYDGDNLVISFDSEVVLIGHQSKVVIGCVGPRSYKQVVLTLRKHISRASSRIGTNYNQFGQT
jgi:hypothetical protein